MLRITIPGSEFWDESKNEFVVIKQQELQLEHSLVSVSKWESKWRKPFLSKEDKTYEESLDYIKCMTITQNVNPLVYDYIPNDIMTKINEYIGSPMTATTFRDDKHTGGSREIITSEIIYYWMIAFNIPFECQKWHLNRLLALIRVCNIKNQPSKNMSRKELLSRNAALNAARRRSMHSRG